MIVRSIKVNKNQIGYMRWCLESHDGIANPTTRAEDPTIIDLTIASDFLDDALLLIEALKSEIGIKEVSPPQQSPLQKHG
jgi:hypothetical protein